MPSNFQGTELCNPPLSEFDRCAWGNPGAQATQGTLSQGVGLRVKYVIIENWQVIVVRELSLGHFRLETFAWRLLFGTFAWELSLGNVRLGTFAWELVRLGSFVWELTLGNFRMGTFA